MTIDEVFAENDLATRIGLLTKQRSQKAADLDQIMEEWDPAKHKIVTDTLSRPDRIVFYTVEADPQVEGSKDREEKRTVKRARISIAMQKLIVRRSTSFAFGNPVKVSSDEDGDSMPVLEAVKRVLKENKSHSHDRQTAKNMFACTEVAELWYGVKTDPFETYGFSSRVKIRTKIFSPLLGDKLYPFFESTGDMTAFSREYKIDGADGNSMVIFETWVADKHYRWKQTNEGWLPAFTSKDGVPVDYVETKLGKIPVIYGCQEQVEWKDVQNLIDRLEVVFSNHADTNDYHASPKIVVSGELKSMTQKGDAGGIIEIDGEGSVNYLAWQQAPESVKLEIDNLLRQIYSMSQTPDISFDSVKGIGAAASGTSLRLLFLDAHLKVQDKMEIYDDFLQRRLNVLKQFMKVLGLSAADQVELTAEVIPFMVDDIADEISTIVSAVQGGIMSKETGTMLNPLILDPVAEKERMQAEHDQTQKDMLAANNSPLDNNSGS